MPDCGGHPLLGSSFQHPVPVSLVLTLVLLQASYCLPLLPVMQLARDGPIPGSKCGHVAQA